MEVREKLEQLRAIEAGMRIDAMEVGEVPLGVDTPEDLERARAMLAGLSHVSAFAPHHQHGGRQVFDGPPRPT